MDAIRIAKIQKLHDQIQNFKACYGLEKLYADRDDKVSAEKLLAFLISNPHFQKIADDVAKLNAEIQENT